MKTMKKNKNQTSCLILSKTSLLLGLYLFIIQPSFAQQTDSNDSSAALSLQEVVTVGNRTAPRVNTTSPLPIDILQASDLQKTGQITMDKMLQYKAPSFNTVNTPVNDATSLLDPWEIRNMGPSRTLVLVNGKRKNTSSLLMVQSSPGRGESGTDMSSVPMLAVESINFLRDGASAQYGSDAIAGVINIKLKQKAGLIATANYGVTNQGDGNSYSAGLNHGIKFSDKGFVNYTLQWQYQNRAVRNGTITLKDEKRLWNTEFFKVLANLGAIPANASDYDDAQVQNFVNNHKSGGGTTNGTPEMTTFQGLVNFGYDINNKWQAYANAGMAYKTAKSNAFYRMTYWPGWGRFNLVGNFNDGFGRFGSNYDGFMPTFEGSLIDYQATAGFNTKLNTQNLNQWNTDFSATVGGNTQDYTVNNSINPSLRDKSPTTFKPGGYAFHHVVLNADFTKIINNQFNIGLGTEFRTEFFSSLAGDTASYYANGAQSFPGTEKANAKSASRNNIGVYAAMEYTPIKQININLTTRVENYSDFGTAFVYKTSAAYQVNDILTLRGSVSTGFKAPSLHQINQQNRISTYIPGEGVDLQMLYNNKSDMAKKMGIPDLKPEKSINYTAGIGIKHKKFLLTLDYYAINIADRIVMTSAIRDNDPETGAGSAFYQTYKADNAKAAAFFINGAQTQTQGLDFVVSYQNIKFPKGSIDLSFAGNYTFENRVVGTPTTPQQIKDVRYNNQEGVILNQEAIALMTTSRPKYKYVLSVNYTNNNFSAMLNNTFFGSTRFQDYAAAGDAILGPTGLLENIAQEFKPAIVSDLALSYKINQSFTCMIAINNILDIKPEWQLVALNDKGSEILKNDVKNIANYMPSIFSSAAFTESATDFLTRGITMGGRFPIGKNGSQFSQLGRQYVISFSYRF